MNYFDFNFSLYGLIICLFLNQIFFILGFYIRILGILRNEISLNINSGILSFFPSILSLIKLKILIYRPFTRLIQTLTQINTHSSQTNIKNIKNRQNYSLNRFFFSYVTCHRLVYHDPWFQFLKGERAHISQILH